MILCTVVRFVCKYNKRITECAYSRERKNHNLVIRFTLVVWYLMADR